MLTTKYWQQRDLDSIGIPIAQLDSDGGIVRINRLCSELVDLNVDDALGRNWFDIYLPHDRYANAIALYQEIITVHDERAIRELTALAVGEYAGGQHIAWQHAPLHAPDGQIAGTFCFGIDVTALAHAERALRVESEEQSALNSILRINLDDVPLKTQLQHVLEVLLSLSWLPVEPKGGIFLVTSDHTSLTLVAQHGLPDVLQRSCAQVPFGYCLCGRAASTGEIQYAAHIDERHDVTYPDITPHGHYNVPILWRGTVMGVIVLYLSEGHVRQERELVFLGNVANTLAGMIVHRRTQEALMSNRTALAEAQRIAHLGSWEWDSASGQFRLSEETFRILGMSPSDESLSLDTVMNLVKPDERAFVHDQLVNVVQSAVAISFDCHLLLPGGIEKDVHIEAEATSAGPEGNSHLNGTLQDVTEKIQAQAAQRLASTVFENTAEGVMITDPKGRIMTVNRALTNITGFSPDEVIGSTSAVFKSGRHDDEFFAAMWEQLRAQGWWQGELWNRRKNGEIYPAWLNINEVRDTGSEVTHYVGVMSDISLMKESESKLDHLAHHDALTELPNRLLLDARLERALAHAHRDNMILAVLMLDLDYFKMINDTLGHPVGDLLLKEAAGRIAGSVRESDTVARLGGDEFTILLEDIQEPRSAGIVANKIITRLAECFVLHGHEVYISASIGISVYPSDGINSTDLIKNADSALYRAKEQGRSNYQYYTEELTTRAMARLAMETELRHALERNELIVYYQPQVDLFSGLVIGMEALLRWQHPERGLVLPGEFVPLAEETGLIVPIGEWVLRTACARLKAWMDSGLPKIRVAVNLSSRQFNQRDLAEVVTGILADTGLDPACLELELTERIIMTDAESAITILQRLKNIGVQFSIDDFGTGYSSLSYLKRFPIDRIKIDQSFVRNITSDPEDAAVSQAIISLSHSLNLKAVAEGVETIEQQEFLRARHCDEIQGFHFSRPIPEEEMEYILRHGNTLHEVLPEPTPHGPTLLIVDDEPHVIEALTRSLRDEGYTIVYAHTGIEALDLLARMPIDVVISDQRMPGMSGTELLYRIRKLYPSVIRIMLTAHVDTKTMTDAINEGAVYKFVMKPWNDDELRTTLRDAFRGP